ncbi:MAG: hypothetical protein ABW205_09025, partial [Burkholderiales bacterium]
MGSVFGLEKEPVCASRQEAYKPAWNEAWHLRAHDLLGQVATDRLHAAVGEGFVQEQRGLAENIGHRAP